ncbi:dihydrofolate reductase family protein [Nocardia mangyaensis]|uniref:dihydrofolate reductase family protein n=1 Tax=Nocardia mangyaensis TaxID=2213200 RepID=UPI003F58422C
MQVGGAQFGHESFPQGGPARGEEFGAHGELRGRVQPGGAPCAEVRHHRDEFDRGLGEPVKDVRIGGGVATVKEFLDADLVDTMHVAVAPVELGRGERLWTSPDELTDRFHLERVPSPSGMVHHFFWRK